MWACILALKKKERYIDDITIEKESCTAQRKRWAVDLAAPEDHVGRKSLHQQRRENSTWRHRELRK